MTDRQPSSFPRVPVRWHWAWSAFCVAGLLGCQALPQAPQQPVPWDLGGNAAVTAPVQQGTALMLETVAGAALPESSVRMLYRLAYAQEQQLQAYQQARWSQPPVALVEQRLRDALGQRHPVLRADGPAMRTETGHWPWLVRAELETFEQVFVQPQTSVGRIRLRVTWVEHSAAGERLRGQRLFAAEVPAPTPDAAGGARALSQAMQEVNRQLLAWLSAGS